MRSLTFLAVFLCYLATSVVATPIAAIPDEHDHDLHPHNIQNPTKRDIANPYAGTLLERASLLTVNPPPENAIACHLGENVPEKPGQRRRGLFPRCNGTPSALWTQYNTEGKTLLATYETKRAAGADKATAEQEQTKFNENYYSDPGGERVAIDMNIQPYLMSQLGLPEEELSLMIQYETYSCKPPAVEEYGPQPLWPVEFEKWKKAECNQTDFAYQNSYNPELGMIVAHVNFGAKDTNPATTKVQLSDVLYLQYRMTPAVSGPIKHAATGLRYLVQDQIMNLETRALMYEAYNMGDAAPAITGHPGWKKWLMSNAEHKKVIETWAATDDGKASHFMLADYAGAMAKKSIVAVHSYLDPNSEAEKPPKTGLTGLMFMVWEFSQ